MKKILLFASALAGLFLAGSCQRENLEPMESANTVTYTVTVPDALATKGIGDDVSNVNTLHYEVYRTVNPNTVEFTPADRLLYHKHATAQSDGTFKIDLELVNDQNFTVLFWAQVGETNEAYDVDDLTAVTIKTPINANQVDYAAFSGRDFIMATEKLASKTVQLTRPVAQINLGTTKASLKAFDTPITISSSSMTVAGLSNTFHVAKLAAGDAFTSTTVYNEQNVLADSLEVNGTKYVNAGMNYVGFASTVGTPVTVSYGINTSEGLIQNTIENVPVKPNFRTNIIGNLITSKTDYTIELLDTWYTPEEVVEVFAVDTAEELQDAIDAIETNETGNIKLEGDIDLSMLTRSFTKSADERGLTIAEGKSVVLDFNGCTLSLESNEIGVSMIENRGNLTLCGEGLVTYKYTGEGDASYGKGNETINNFGTLEIDGPTVQNTTETMSHASYAIDNREGASLTLNSGNILNLNGHALRMASFGTEANEVVINGGLIKGSRAVQIHFPSNSSAPAPEASLTVNGGTLESNEETYNLAVYAYSAGQSGANATITLNNGTFNGNIAFSGSFVATVHDGTFNGSYGVYSYDENAVVSIKGGTFSAAPTYYGAYVADDYVAVQNGDVYNVVEAFAKVGETKYTSLDAAFAAALELDEATITVLRDSKIAAVEVAKGKTITLDLNGKTVSNITTGTGNQDVILVKGTLNVTNGTITTEHKGENLGWSAMSTIFDITAGGIVNLNGVTAKNLGGTDMGFVAHLNNWGEVTLTAENCTLESNYVAVRVFNSGYDKNNVTIKNSTLKGGNYAFWVHNYTVADFGTAEKAIAQQKLLKFNLTEGNTFVGKNDTPIRLGMTGSMYLAADQIGNLPTYASVDSEETLIAALKNASTVNSIIYFANNITISNKWDNRYTGAKTSKPIEINGNSKTLKFVGEISDGYNYHAAFRFENSAVVKNLTVDMSEATAPGNWLRAISSHGELTVVNCAFVGSGKYSKANAVVFGDKSGSAQHDYTATITDCTFTNWSRGISDNENANEVRSVTVKNNTCTSAHVYLSAYETVTFTGNTMDNSCVNIKSYSAPDSVIITVEDNDLDENQDNKF